MIKQGGNKNMISKQIIKVMRHYNSVFNKYNKISEEIIELLITQ